MMKVELTCNFAGSLIVKLPTLTEIGKDPKVKKFSPSILRMKLLEFNPKWLSGEMPENWMS